MNCIPESRERQERNRRPQCPRPVEADVSRLKLLPQLAKSRLLRRRSDPAHAGCYERNSMATTRQRPRCRGQTEFHRCVAADVSRLKLLPQLAKSRLLRRRSDPAHAGCYERNSMATTRQRPRCRGQTEFHRCVAADVSRLKLLPQLAKSRLLRRRSDPAHAGCYERNSMATTRQRPRCHGQTEFHRCVAADVSRLKLLPQPAKSRLLRRRSDPAHAGCYERNSMATTRQRPRCHGQTEFHRCVAADVSRLKLLP